MPRPLFETSTPAMLDLFSNGKQYDVPNFQREYSWEEEHWDDLWTDLVELPPGGRHYMGAIVLQQSGELYTIIDGQQRLATLSVLALAAIAQLRNSAAELTVPEREREDNRERAQLLHASFIGFREASSLHVRPKLRLNQTDNDFYQTYLVAGGTPPNPKSLTGSRRRLWQAFLFFERKLRERFGNESGATLAGFVESVAKALTFIQIVVEDDLSAFTVFETLNARGLELTQSDLLKNYLFSLSAPAEEDVDQARRLWNEVASRVDAKNHSTFLRHFMNARNPWVRKEALFKTIKSKVKSRDAVFPFLRDLGVGAAYYAALEDPTDGVWMESPPSRQHLRALNLFGVTQYRPLLLAAMLADWPADQVERLLHAVLVISLRFNIIARRNTQEQERVYNAAALGIKEEKSLAETIRTLEPIYVPDREFVRDFSVFSTKSHKAKLVKYLLFAVERRLSGTDLDFETSSATIEHILPENPGGAWAGFAESHSGRTQDLERFIYRIGNLAILTPPENRDVGSISFAEKQRIYRQSGFHLTRSLADYADWTPSAIDQRQEKMARHAQTIWRVDALSEALS